MIRKGFRASKTIFTEKQYRNVAYISSFKKMARVDLITVHRMRRFLVAHTGKIKKATLD